MGIHDGRLCWLERRPAEQGRSALVGWTAADGVLELSPPEARIGSRVHEYGGGAWCSLPSGVGYVDRTGVWRTAPDGASVLLAPAEDAGEEIRYGDLTPTPDGRFVLAVRETLRGDDVERAVVALSVTDPGPAVEICTGRDFFSAPRPSRDGRLAWLAWDHPDMSWDAAELWVGRLVEEDGRLALGDPERLDGGPGASVGQPHWLDDASLVYAGEAAGWWQPWRWRADAGTARLSDDEAEFHGPDWTLGLSTMAELTPGRLVCVRRREGRDEIVVLDLGGGDPEVLDQPCGAVSALCRFGRGLAWLGATPSEPGAPWVWIPGRRPRPVLGHERPLGRRRASVGEPFTYPGEAGRVVHGLFYRPARAPRAAPPLVVVCHGGPTGSADPGFDPFVQLLAQQGIAVAAVDFAGSTGYGRAFRRSLEGGWGVTDVRDCLAAARCLAEDGRVDGRSMAIRGKSAGGLTALGALAEDDLFAGAVSWYGVTDLLHLAEVTHDFERHYTDRLVGPLPAAAAEYRRRSPVHRVDQIQGAVLLFQGLEDPVVPPSQARAMAEALRDRGVPCRLLTFEGEGHGFRQAETLWACLEAEVAFYQELFFENGHWERDFAGRVGTPRLVGETAPSPNGET